MDINYNLFSQCDCFEKIIAKKNFLHQKKGKSILKKLLVLFVILSGITNINGQTTLIDPAGAGGFNLGSTFTANGWTVANQGTGITKWVVGNAVTASNLGTTQATTATGMPPTSFIVTLAASNTTIAIGQAVSGSNIAPNTYVSNISSTTLTLSQPTTNSTTISSAVTLTFTSISANISGNSAYVSTDNGLTNGYNYNAARRIYFYRDVTLPSDETAYSLTFDVRSNGVQFGDSWQVLIAPTTVTPVGTDSQIAANVPPAVPEGLTGALPLTYGAGFLYTQSIFTSIPPSYAGQTVRLIFMWTNDSSGGASYPAAIDNIKLTSRVAGDITSVSSGIFSNASTWDVGVPTAADNAIVQAGNAVNIDKRSLRVFGLYVNGFVDYGFNSDELTVQGDVQISGSGSRFNDYFTTSTGIGKSLKVGGDINILSGGRFDASVTSSTLNQGLLTLNGSVLQTVTVDSSSFLGASTTATTTSSNTAGIIGQLVFNNTSTATPNINWNVNTAIPVRIKNYLKFTSGRVALSGTAKFILGDYAALSDGTTSSGLYISNGQGFLGGTVGRYFTTSSTSSSTLFENGAEYITQPYPFISANGDKRFAFIVRPSVAGAVAGEIYITYADSNSMSSSSVVDGAYTINKRYNGNWTISNDGVYANTAGTDLAFSAMGAYNALDGSSRILHSFTAASGTHVNGTNSPFVMRSGVTASDLFAGAFYVGVTNASVQLVTKTSTGTGDWNVAQTWTPNGVPSCSDVVAIASGHTVTVNDTASAAGVNILSGGTLVNASGTLTVGCTNNNASFINAGTYTISGGTLAVNGNVLHKPGSTLNQTGGDIVVDGNHAGDVATSVGQGTSLFKIDNPNAVNLAAGKITIVDPLVNSVLNTSATTVTNFTASTTGTTGTFSFSTNSAAAIGTTTLTFSPFNDPYIFTVGSYITGNPGIPTGTTVTAVTVSQTGNVTMIISNQLTSAIASGTSLNFSSMSNGNANIYFTSADAVNLAVGQIVTGTGIPENSTITSMYGGVTYTRITLSNPVTGLTTSPINLPVTLTFSGASAGCATFILNAANPAIKLGQAISGTGIATGTTVSSIDGVKLVISTPAVTGISAPATVNFYDGNPSAFAFVYNSAKHSIAGINHTLQFGNGSSTETGSVITNGFLVNTSFGGGVLSLGNLSIDALNADRYFNSNNILNVQNTTTIATGSVFQKTKQANLSPINYGATYFGGSIINNGTVITRQSGQPFVMANYFNGAETATTLSQTISGSGSFYDNYDMGSFSNGGGGSVGTLKINNNSIGGVTLNFPNFISEISFSMIAGILHTSATYPLYVGTTVYGSNPSIDINSNFSNTCYVDGPIIKTFSAATSSASITSGSFLFPVGKLGTYLPISMAPTGAAGLVIKAEAFTSNGGVPSANIANLSKNRWKVERIGTTGTLTDFKVRVGASDITANHIPVQATIDEDTYDNVLGTATFAAPGVNSLYPINNITTNNATIVSGPSFPGFFSYATNPNCSGMPTPGNTVASATSVCGGQTITLSLQNPTTSFGVTYQWQASINSGTTYIDISGATSATYVATVSADTYYRCNVSCGSITGTSTPILVTVTISTITGTSPDTICYPTSNTATLGATASSGTINWYDSATGGIAIGTGSPFTTPTISATTTFYVGTDSTTPNSFTKTFSGSTTLNDNYSGMVFNTSSKIVLKTVIVYPKQTSVNDNVLITVAVFDATGNLVGTPKTFTPTANTTTTLLPQTVDLNITIPAGTGYQLLAISGMSSLNGLGRNTQTLPFTQGAVTITNGLNNSGGALNTTYNQFYDWTWDEVCSTARVPVVATVNQAPAVEAITGTTSACVGSTTTLASTTTGGVWTSETTSVATVDSASGLVTGVSAGTSMITYTVTTNGCSTSVTTTVTINALPVVEVITGTTNACAGSTTTLASITTGGVWTSETTSVATVDSASGVVTGISAGTSIITYTVTTNGCSASATTTVTINALPVVEAITGNTNISIGTTTTLFSTTTDGVWASETTSVATVDPVSGVVTGVSAGTSIITYTVTTNGCSTSVTTSVTVSDLGNDTFDLAKLSYYPNPIKDVLNISYVNNINAISIYNLLGQELTSETINANLAKIDMSALPNATYMVKINLGDNIIKIIKVIKQ